MDETLFELDKDGYYILYIIYYIILQYFISDHAILYHIVLYYIILYCIILYYIILNFILNNYKPIITGNFFSSNYIEYESNDALFVKEYLNHA